MAFVTIRERSEVIGIVQALRSGINWACLIALCSSFLLSPSCKTLEVPEPDAVFLVVVDTLRADGLSCYGATARRTPNIDRLASQGVTFINAHSPSSWTRPAMGSIMTSHYPTRIGLVEQEEKNGEISGRQKRRRQARHQMMPQKKCLAAFMSEAGFLTAAFVNQPGLSADRGFNRHFSSYFYPASLGRIRHLRQDEKFGDQAQKWGRARDALADDETLINAFTDWLQSLDLESQVVEQKRIVVWLHLLAPHRPYLPPEEFSPARGGDHIHFMSARYNGEVMAEDILVGKALDAIARHVGLDRSLIIFCADHGEEFWEHGSNEHGHSMYGEVIRVPLIICSPGLPHGLTVKQHVSTIDILPTILDITKTSPAKGWGIADKFAGHSLLPLLLEGNPDRDWHPLYSEGVLYGSTKRSLIIDNHKLIYDQKHDHWSLYDIGVDPGETEDLAADHPELTATMRRELEKIHLENVKDRDAALRDLKETGQTDDDRRRTEKALEALGYIDG